MGEGRRPETVAAADEDPHPEITLRQISAWSLAILAAVAVRLRSLRRARGHAAGGGGFRRRRHVGSGGAETRSAARSAPARGAAAGGQRDADHRFGDPVDLPARVRTREWLAGHGRVAEGKAARIRWSDRSVAASHLDDWRTPQRRCGGDPFARDFLGSIDALGLVAADHRFSVLSCRAALGDLRMARLAARSRHDVRKPRFPSDGAEDSQRNRIRIGQLSVDRDADQRWRRGGGRRHLLR